MCEYKNCKLCPRECGIDRTKVVGACKATNKVKVALASIHNFEEPCISGDEGSGTVFFSNCNLRCVYCQNFEISRDGFGKEITIERLAEIFLEQQSRGVNNINLVTPTMYVDSIIEAIKIAKKNGLTIPIVYNSSGYEKADTIKKLEGYIDVYLPDFKYATNRLSLKYSGVNNYVESVVPAIHEMIKQVGTPVFNDKGIMTKGVIIRHMILPNNVLNTKMVLKKIKEEFKEKTLISVMAQYFPSGDANKYPEINRKIIAEELQEVENCLNELEMENGYIQEIGEHEEEYVPNFDLSNI
ncbi:MAG: radical SAM protein [Clostridia bacterium]|nr:radical SAM protein [Clostridia bacterium]